MYINDICNLSQLLNFFLFADDTNILYMMQMYIVNCELDKLYTWFSVNKLSLNASKTNDIFGDRRINCHLDIHIHNDLITRVSKTTFLGILIDKKLTWKDQINNVMTNLSRVARVVYRASHVLGTTCLLTLSYSLFLLFLLCFCCEVWGKCMYY